jgi:hypothetical protein
MLLPIRHDHAEFVRIALDRMLSPIQRAAVEYGNSRQVTASARGHDEDSQRSGLIATEKRPLPPDGGATGTTGMLRSSGFERLDRQYGRSRSPTFSETVEHKSGINERTEQRRQGHVRSTNLVPETLVCP